jgi:tetratricopeptide (TPR) repeat protein
MKSNSVFILILVLFPLMGNGQDQTPQAQSLSGKPLFSPPVDVKIAHKCDSIISVIKSKPNLSEDDFIEIGKQMVAKGNYKEAVVNFSEGLAQFPNSFKLLRYRGHRYLTLRKLDLVVKDLLKARALIKSQPDVWEVDAKGKQTDTYQHQIEYHLGVYYFLKRDYNEAVNAFQNSLKAAHEPNELVGTTDWLYNAYQRNRQNTEAEKLLKNFIPDARADKDQAYFRRILLYKGEVKPDQLVDESVAAEKLSIQEATRMYGLANWYSYQGDKNKANELYAKILGANNAWPAFAYLCSEAELLK